MNKLDSLAAAVHLRLYKLHCCFVVVAI